MRLRTILIAVCTLWLGHALLAWAEAPPPPAKPGQGEPPAPAPNASGPADPFTRAPAGKTSVEKTERGLLVISNIPGNRYTFELAGKEIDGKGDTTIWRVDGLLLQVLSVPLTPDGELPDAQTVLRQHQKYENDDWAKKGWNEIESARKWLRFASGEPALYWELKAPKDKDPDASSTPATKTLFATALNGRNVIVMAATVFAKDDEAADKKRLVDTVLSLAPHEKNDTAPPVNSGDAMATLLNDELASRKDRQAEGAVVLKPENLMLLIRMALQLQPNSTFMTFVFDGHEGHAINLLNYDPKEKGFVYWDPRGKDSFLEEDNNRAGVKAVHYQGKNREFLVSETELQKVLQGVIVDYRCVRPYFASDELKGAVHEYTELRQKDPDSVELKEEWLLNAARLLAEGGKDARGVNVYAVCHLLYDKSSRALAGIAEIYAKIGKPEPAVNFYKDALKKLPEDKSLNDARRKELAAAWEAARQGLEAKLGKDPERP